MLQYYFSLRQFRLMKWSFFICSTTPSLGSSLIIFSSFLFFRSLIEINNGQPISLMWYSFILLFFRILALKNIDDWTQAILRLTYYIHAKLDSRIEPKFSNWKLHLGTDL